MAELMAEGGLVDGPGKAWILVSGQVGCMTRRPGHTVHAGRRVDGAGESRDVWLRRVVIDTFSRDQGWSDNPRSYGVL